MQVRHGCKSHQPCIMKSTFFNRKSGFLNRRSGFFNRKSTFFNMKSGFFHCKLTLRVPVTAAVDRSQPRTLEKRSKKRSKNARKTLEKTLEKRSKNARKNARRTLEIHSKKTLEKRSKERSKGRWEGPWRIAPERVHARHADVQAQVELPPSRPRWHEVPRIANQSAVFQQNGIVFSGAILHYLCIFNRKSQKKPAFISLRRRDVDLCAKYKNRFSRKNGGKSSENTRKITANEISPTPPALRRSSKFIIFSTQFLVFNAQFLVYNTTFLGFNAKFIDFTHLGSACGGFSDLSPKPSGRILIFFLLLVNLDF